MFERSQIVWHVDHIDAHYVMIGCDVTGDEPIYTASLSVAFADYSGPQMISGPAGKFRAAQPHDVAGAVQHAAADRVRRFLAFRSTMDGLDQQDITTAWAPEGELTLRRSDLETLVRLVLGPDAI